MDETKIIQKLIEHDEELAKINKRLDDVPTRNEIFGKLDEIMKILLRLDQERVVTVEWIQRVEGVVSEHTSIIKKLREKLEVV